MSTCGSSVKVALIEAEPVEELRPLGQLQQIEISDGTTFSITSECGCESNVMDRELGSVCESLLNPPDHHSPNNILNALNDDCFRAILERNEISISDFCAFASTCTRLSHIGFAVFQRKYTEKHKFSVTETPELTSVWQLDAYFSTGGQWLKTIDIQYYGIKTQTHFYI